MKDVDVKAVRLILEGKVHVDAAILDEDGLVLEALGVVKGDSGKSWLVHIDGDSTYCNCPYGTMREDAGGHSHDLALRLAATKS